MSHAYDKLSSPVQKWIRLKEWRELRDIQTHAIHSIIDTDADIIISASTAGGKTEAAFLPLISQVLDDSVEGVGFDIICVSPLKALITDQAERLEDICKATDIPIFPWHGDISQSVKTRARKNPQGILLITPESLEALLIRRGNEVVRLFNRTRAVVIDELHSLLDSVRGVQLRSLLTRLETICGRGIRRIGLSATLGDFDLACTYLRPDNDSCVQVIRANSDESELKVQLRGYEMNADPLFTSDEQEGHQSATSPEPEDIKSSTPNAIAAHLFKHLRGSDNLVFAGSRNNVEIYADKLRQKCEKSRLPNEFYAHHGNLARQDRQFVEQRLKDSSTPTTAICTSTLELGIDIGDIASVAQIGAPYGVASLRQRLGRSGRRKGQPSVLRQYIIEESLSSRSSIVDRLRLGLMRSIAMIELLLENWCEPPKPEALHLSTLVHQILSVIAERGGIVASQLYSLLCREGPFRQISPQVFKMVLHKLGDQETKLIEQPEGDELLLGAVGERLVEHYSFYAVFMTPKEFRIVCDGKELGTLPITNILTPGMLLIFSGRRWSVIEVLDEDRVVTVAPAKAGKPPKFDGDPGEIHDMVIQKMFKLFESDYKPLYLDRTASKFLDEARRNYKTLGLANSSVVSIETDKYAIATRVGSIKTNTLALALRRYDFQTSQHDGFILIDSSNVDTGVRKTLKSIIDINAESLLTGKENLVFDKYHWCLSRALLEKDALSVRLDVSSLPELCRRILR